MKKFLLFSFFLFFPAFSYSQNIKQLVASLPPFLEEEIKSTAGLPTPFGALAQRPLYLSARPAAVAEYVPKTDKMYLSKKPLRQWLAAHPAADAQQLARCLAPVYIHELAHARQHQAARAQGFVWPVTIEDEYMAVFWQVYFIRQKTKQNPAYYQDCTPFMPPKAFLEAKDASRLARQVFVRYTSGPGPILPPPLQKEQIEQLLAQKTISYNGRLFAPKRRVLSVNSFFKKGGSWLEIRPRELATLQTAPHYFFYQQKKGHFRDEILSCFPDRK